MVGAVALVEARRIRRTGMSKEDAAYINMRLATMGPQDKAAMQSCLEAHPALG